jgi:CheY-like chemotaxis protein
MENEAGQVYTEAAKLFTDNAEFSYLLRNLAKDECLHHELLATAQQWFQSNADTVLEPAYLTLDDNTKKKIKAHLIKFVREINRGTLTVDETLKHIIDIEFSEWNDLFAYVLGSMKDTTSNFIDVATKIQQHRRRIERFIENHPEHSHYLKSIQPLPTLWNENILIIESSDVIANMLYTILNEEGTVDRVATFDKALERIDHKFYSAIISNVDLPPISDEAQHNDGIELYKTALGKFPNIRKRFIFFTGNSDHISFFKKSGIKHLVKPTPIDKIRRAVVEAIEDS